MKAAQDQLERLISPGNGAPIAPAEEVARMLDLYEKLSQDDKAALIIHVAEAYMSRPSEPHSVPHGDPSSPATIAAFFSPYSDVRYEKVWHAMTIAEGGVGFLVDVRGVAVTWRDLKQRVGGLGDGRIVLGFFHDGMRGDVVAFVEIGFFEEVKGDVQAIVTDANPVYPTNPSTAIFYSINSPHAGLTGIDMGHMLLKRCVPHLFSNYRITTFCTLSPIPGFRSWFESKATAGEVAGSAVEPEYRLTDAQLSRILGPETWIEDESFAEEVRIPLTRWCAR
ncbi:hypothetical protein HDU93_009601 [Gonapodya sp. JEL0774]|nr:hypothetical protein HDU93_009601 [Gonapodya sp. JEL0774]